MSEYSLRDPIAWTDINEYGKEMLNVMMLLLRKGHDNPLPSLTIIIDYA